MFYEEKNININNSQYMFYEKKININIFLLKKKSLIKSRFERLVFDDGLGPVVQS